MILNFCGACGEKDVTKLEHHHLVPRSAGGTDDPKNLITLCHTCHGRAHGYERVNLRKLAMRGQAAAKAKGRLPGNPGMRSRDPEALRQISEASKKRFMKRLVATSNIWLPIVQKMRPSAKWIDVLQAVNEAMGEQWTKERLRRAIRKLADEGLVDPVLLDNAPQSKGSTDAIGAER
jgi:hypothetical protein